MKRRTLLPPAALALMLIMLIAGGLAASAALSRSHRMLLCGTTVDYGQLECYSPEGFADVAARFHSAVPTLPQIVARITHLPLRGVYAVRLGRDEAEAVQPDDPIRRIFYSFGLSLGEIAGCQQAAYLLVVENDTTDGVTTSRVGTDTSGCVPRRTASIAVPWSSHSIYLSSTLPASTVARVKIAILESRR